MAYKNKIYSVKRKEMIGMRKNSSCLFYSHPMECFAMVPKFIFGNGIFLAFWIKIEKEI
jgi:hypothetical protein